MLSHRLSSLVLIAGMATEVAAEDRYVIAHTADLASAAQAWATYRAADGWAVRLVPVAPGTRATTVRQAIHDRCGDDPADRVMVLILGDAGDDGVPTWYDRQDDSSLIRRDPRTRTFATDDPYQHRDDDAAPDIPLGRVPAATVGEALAVLEKIRRYEGDAPAGSWRRRVTYVAGEGHFGAMDDVFEQMFRTMVERIVPPAYDLSMTYAKASSEYCPPPSRITETILERLGEGALLFNYVGHGWHHGFDDLRLERQRVPTLRTDDVAAVRSDGASLPIALLTCCSTGWYDLPGEHCIAEAMLFNPRGPIAVIAGSRLTHPYANIVLQKDVNQLLLHRRVETVGELDLLALRSMLTYDRLDRQLDALTRPVARMGAWETSLRDLRTMHVKLYNLLGDPALRIAHARARVEDLAYDDETGRLTGRVDGMTAGEVVVTIETRAGTPVRGADDVARIDDREERYAAANDRVLRTVAGRVENERLDVDLTRRLPRRAAVIKVIVDGDGIEATGSYLLPFSPN